ncbi:MAG TPA: glucosyl-3-phosphoglycerate synthase [Candidatus Dormibacteraeota bacterium]
MPDRRPHVLVPILRVQAAPALLRVASAVCENEGGTGHVLGVVEIPAGREIARSITVARRYRALLQRITSVEEREASGFGVQVRVGHSVSQAVREAAYESGSTLIVVEWPGFSKRPADQNLDDLVADPPADLLLVRPGESRRSSISRILVPVRGGPSAALALRTAAALARGRRAALTVMHVYDPRLSHAQRVQERETFNEALKSLGRIRHTVKEVDAGAAAAIRAEAENHDLVVLGAYADTAHSSVVVGLRLVETVRRLPGNVIVAKSARSVTPVWDIESGPPVTPAGDIQGVVDRWFAENTFHSREFKDIRRLVRLKREQGLSISLGLPTLNEEATIGRIISVMQEALVEDQPLLDEIVVVDSGSSDETVNIARSLGVRVHRHQDVLPEYGSHAGKGEALWKSLHLLTGDLVVWCDTDISNIHPQFVYGTLGPLLTDPRIGYVKGFYRRPLNFGGEIQTAGGGRVTELAARPLINLFYPELSGLLQPLSGEYAGRRELLERLPFFTGYGVEIGHLIDIVEIFGLNRIAQVDLGVRIHRNQELFNLSKMAFAIMQVALKRLGDRHRMHLVEEVNRTMKLIHYEGDRFFLELKDIGDQERPPLATLPEYLARRFEVRAPHQDQQQNGSGRTQQRPEAEARAGTG